MNIHQQVRNQKPQERVKYTPVTGTYYMPFISLYLLFTNKVA